MLAPLPASAQSRGDIKKDRQRCFTEALSCVILSSNQDAWPGKWRTSVPASASGSRRALMSAPIFISFASKDLSVARTVCEALENRGFNCWISSRDIGPGENFQVAIVRAIRIAKVMILVFSGHSNISEEVKKELVLAGQSRLVVIPLRVEDVAPDEAFAYEFATRQWIDAFHDWEHAIQRVVDQLLLVDDLRGTTNEISTRSGLPHDDTVEPRHATAEKRGGSGESPPVSPSAVSARPTRAWRWVAFPAVGFLSLAVAILIWFGTSNRTPTMQKPDIAEKLSPSRAAVPSPTPPPPSTVQREASSTLPAKPAAEAPASAAISNPRITEIGNNTQKKSPGSDLLGLWGGSSACAQGDIGVELSLKEVQGDGIVRGSLRFFNLPGKNNTGEGEYSLQGRYYDADHTLYLKPEAWIKQPPGYSMASFSFTFQPRGPSLTGRVSNVACSTISVTKVGGSSAAAESSR